jgi:DNA repair exonuclease SbcCD ATPase subunit/DNA repair exonuclease SbcCD nuclease subunit
MKIAHIADVHIRGFQRHEEYRKSFEDLFASLSIEQPDVILVVGDIVHSKTHNITPELIEITTWFFKSLADVAPVHMVLGNHDGLIHNKDRQDAITPIVTAINSEKIKLWKKSGEIFADCSERISIHSFSCFDEESWSSIAPRDGHTNIALFHGSVNKCLSDQNVEMTGVSMSMFEGFDFGIFGDIHKRQSLDGEGRFKYCGSLIQQNFGEETDKGYLVWNIKDRSDWSCNFVKVKNDHPFITIDANTTPEDIESIPLSAKVRIIAKDKNDPDVLSIVRHLKKDKKISDVIVRETESQLRTLQDTVLSTGDVSYLDYFSEYVAKNVDDPAMREKIVQEFSKYLEQTDYSESRSVDHWSLKSLKFNNLFSYGESNSIDFDKLSGITGIFAKNRAGKSSIVGSLCYALFNEVDRSLPRSHFIINSDSDSCDAEVIFSARSNDYLVKRSTTRVKTKKGESSTTNVSLGRFTESGSVMMDDEQRRETDKIVRGIIGSPSDFFESAVASQGQLLNFLDHKSTSRKQILTKFLGLDAYERVYELARADLSPIRHLLKGDTKISDLRSEIDETQIRILSLLQESNGAESREAELQKLLNQISGESLQNALKIQKSEISKNQRDELQKEYQSLCQSTESLREQIADFSSKIEKLDSIADSSAAKSAQLEIESFSQRENDIKLSERDLNHRQQIHESLLSSCRILDEVPCGDQFSSCQFKRDALDAREKVQEAESTLSALVSTIESARKEIDSSKIAALKDAVEKAAKAADLRKKIILQRTLAEEKIDQNTSQGVKLRSKISLLEKDIIQGSIDTAVLDSKKNIDIELGGLTERRNQIVRDMSKAEGSVERMKIELADLEKDYNRAKLLSSLIENTSKHGVQAQMVKDYLPKINGYISDLISPFFDFSVELSLDPATGDLDIFFTDAISRRQIESCSGMEKMISAIAIRAALSRVSRLPKPSIFVIDEGFGALDENNLDMCTRLLSSLKMHFKNIIIISHIDEIKDSVDHMIEITHERGRSNVRA